jgi:osmoprotectant transport system permease protein
VRVGSKAMPESVILGEMVALLAKNTGAHVEHRRGLGGTRVLWNALQSGDIDLYPEYTGTISEEILAGQGVRGTDALRDRLAGQGIRMSLPLGFNNTYAIGMRQEEAVRLGIRTISDLRSHPNLKLGFSNEFLDRADGWPGLRAWYQLPQQDVRGLAHDLAYQGLLDGKIAATDLYSTDAKIRRYNLRVLTDDRHYFPAYQAVLLFRADLEERAPEVVTALHRLEGQITEATMVDLNARVEIDHQPEPQVAADFLAEHLAIHGPAHVETAARYLLRLTLQHVTLVAVSLIAALLLAVPLGIVAARWPKLGRGFLALTGIFQTIPSIALLVFLIPLLGIGAAPAIAALFLYSLLPIVQNTCAGLQAIPASLRETAAALGLPSGARLRLIELPLAAGMILAGIETAAVINVGTAVLGGFIGAGGYGEAIFIGIPKGDMRLIMQGAIPAALLALAVQAAFQLAGRFLIPKGLRLKTE